MAISKTMQERIALHTNSFVATWFAIFQNPVNRGTNFTWDRFPEMMARDYNRVFLTFTINNPKEEHYQLMQDLLRKEAQRLVSLMKE